MPKKHKSLKQPLDTDMAGSLVPSSEPSTKGLNLILDDIENDQYGMVKRFTIRDLDTFKSLFLVDEDDAEVTGISDHIGYFTVDERVNEYLRRQHPPSRLSCEYQFTIDPSIFSKFPKLEDITFDHTRGLLIKLSDFANVKQLKHLCIGGAPGDNKYAVHLTHSDLKDLTQFPQLETVSFTYQNELTGSLGSLKDLKNLQYFTLDTCSNGNIAPLNDNYGDIGTFLQQHSNLRSLYIWDTNVTGQIQVAEVKECNQQLCVCVLEGRYAYCDDPDALHDTIQHCFDKVRAEATSEETDESSEAFLVYDKIYDMENLFSVRDKSGIIKNSNCYTSQKNDLDSNFPSYMNRLIDANKDKQNYEQLAATKCDGNGNIVEIYIKDLGLFQALFGLPEVLTDPEAKLKLMVENKYRIESYTMNDKNLMDNLRMYIAQQGKNLGDKVIVGFDPQLLTNFSDILDTIDFQYSKGSTLQMDLSHCPKLPYLKTLKMQHADIILPEKLQRVCPDLDTLEISQSTVKGNLSNIDNLSKLNSLKLQEVSGLTGDLKSLAKCCPNLTTLQMTKNQNLSGRLASLSSLSKLTDLQLDRFGSRLVGAVNNLSSLSSLVDLTLDTGIRDCDKNFHAHYSTLLQKNRNLSYVQWTAASPHISSTCQPDTSLEDMHSVQEPSLCPDLHTESISLPLSQSSDIESEITHTDREQDQASRVSENDDNAILPTQPVNNTQQSDSESLSRYNLIQTNLAAKDITNGTDVDVDSVKRKLPSGPINGNAQSSNKHVRQ